MKKIILLIILLLPLTVNSATVGFRNHITVTAGSINANVMELDNGTLIAGGNNQSAANSDQIQRSTDKGANWTMVLDMGVDNQSFRAPFLASNDYLYFGTEYSVSNGIAKMYRSVDAGLNWTDVLTSSSSAFWFFDEASNGVIYALPNDSSTGYLFASYDDGETWGELTFTLSNNSGSMFINGNSTSSKVYISTAGNYVTATDYTKAELEDLYKSTAEVKGTITITTK